MKRPHDPFPEEEVRLAIHKGIAEAEGKLKDRENIKHGFKINNAKRKLGYVLCSAIVVFGILFVSSFYSPTLASNLSQLPIIGSIFGNSDLIGLRQAHEKGLTSEIGETQTVDGISVTLDEILYDQNDITIGLYIESENKLDDFYFGAGMDFTIDGKLPTASTGSYGEEILSDTTRTAIQEINITEEMPEEFELGLTLHGQNGEKFYFSTPVKKIESDKVLVNHSQTVDGLTLIVPEISISESGIGIAYESLEEETDFDLSRGGNIDFFVVDQDGNEITGHSGGASGELVKDKIFFKSIKQFDPLDSDVSELTITPILEIPSAGGGVEIGEDGTEKELEFKGNQMKPIEFESFKVKIPQ